MSPSHDDNLEIFSLIWLDEQVNITEENRQAQSELRLVINHLKTFADRNQCHQYIASHSPQDRLILIVSGRCGRQLVPEIHHLRQLFSVYIYCMDTQTNKQWAGNFPKIKDVFSRLDDLINQIKSDQRSRVKREEPLSIKIFNNNSDHDQSTTGLNGHFVHSLLLIDVLLRMKSIETDKQQLITLCKTLYKNSHTQLAIVREFEHQYTSDKAIWWYTRESFVYQMLNKALRVQNIDLLFLFRFVISDIYRQLIQYQCQSSVRVYRGQVMSNDELKILRQSIDKFISINSFFSTSRHRHNAMDFLYSSNISNDLCRVLFIINANPRLAKSKPFADISSLSDIINESEVLFMIGCIFRLNDICYDDNKQIWKIQMDLCGDDEYDLKNLFNHIKNEYGCGENEVDLQSFGNVLHQMGKYDLAEKIYHRLLVETPSNDPSYSHLCYSLGMLTKDIKQYDLSLQWFQKSLEITISKDSVNSIHIAGLYCCIGNVYKEQGNDNEAMDYYNIAIDYYRQAHAENHPHMAALYHGVASIHHDYKNYVEALNYYKQSLAIQEKYLPSAHSDIATNYDSIGTIHRHFREYDLAMNQHRRALEVRQKSLPSEHPDIGTSYKNMGLLYEARKEWSQALMYYRKAADIFRHSLSSQHPNVIEIEKDIHRASSIVK